MQKFLAKKVGFFLKKRKIQSWGKNSNIAVECGSKDKMVTFLKNPFLPPNNAFSQKKSANFSNWEKLANVIYSAYKWGNFS